MLYAPSRFLLIGFGIETAFQTHARSRVRLFQVSGTDKSIALLSWFSFLFSVCQPLAETNAAEPTESTDIISTISTATDTPKILFTADDELPGHSILLL
jgi:hypothetical protein